jgi:type IV secretory pathway protease TraF
MPERARANRKIHFTTHVHSVAFRAHAESAYCDNSIVPLLNTALRVTFPAPVILRGAIYCTGVAVRTCEKRDRNGRPIRSQFLPRIAAAQGYPEKQFRKTSLR